VHFEIRLEEGRQCILVLMGATADGKKELIAIADGYREIAQSWRELLQDVKARGLNVDPKLATDDGALGFWKALSEVWPATREQRCCVHKTANVLNKRPKRDVILTFYAFPAEHWIHLRTTNPIESTFATVIVNARPRATPRGWLA
jgi:putative transposase